MAFTTSIGGCMLCFGSASGLALMKMERMHVVWYLKNCTPKILLGWIVGLIVLWAESLI